MFCGSLSDDSGHFSIPSPGESCVDKNSDWNDFAIESLSLNENEAMTPKLESVCEESTQQPIVIGDEDVFSLAMSPENGDVLVSGENRMSHDCLDESGFSQCCENSVDNKEDSSPEVHSKDKGAREMEKGSNMIKTEDGVSEPTRFEDIDNGNPDIVTGTIGTEEPRARYMDDILEIPTTEDQKVRCIEDLDIFVTTNAEDQVSELVIDAGNTTIALHQNGGQMEDVLDSTGQDIELDKTGAGGECPEDEHDEHLYLHQDMDPHIGHDRVSVLSQRDLVVKQNDPQTEDMPDFSGQCRELDKSIGDAGESAQDEHFCDKRDLIAGSDELLVVDLETIVTSDVDSGQSQIDTIVDPGIYGEELRIQDSLGEKEEAVKEEKKADAILVSHDRSSHGNETEDEHTEVLQLLEITDVRDQPTEPWEPCEYHSENSGTSHFDLGCTTGDQASVTPYPGLSASSKQSVRAKKRKKQKAKLEKYLAKYMTPTENRRRKYAMSFKELLPCPEDEFHPDFTCPVCLDLYHRPHVVSPCQHMFCEPCLRKLPSSALADNAVCPLCRCDIRACSLDVDLHLQLSTYYSNLYSKRARQEKKLRTNQNPLPRLHTTPLSQQILRQIFRNNQSQRRNQTNGFFIFLGLCMSAVLCAFYVWVNIPIEITTGPLRNAAISNIWIQAMCLFALFSWLFIRLLQTFADGIQR